MSEKKVKSSAKSKKVNKTSGAKTAGKTNFGEFLQKYRQIIIPSVFLVIILIGIVAYALTMAQNTNPSIITALGNNNYSVELSGDLRITTPGTYELAGEIADGVVAIKTSGEVKLVLNNVRIKNSHGPAIFVEDAERVTLELAAGTENYLEDDKTYKGYAENELGVIFSHDDLVIEGEGKLTVQANNSDGIASKDDLTIKSGNFEINAAEDGIYGKDSVTIESGDFTIKAAGKGIKSTNTEEDKAEGVKIAGGSFNLDCTDDALHSNSNIVIDGGVFEISTGDDAMHADGDLTINNGKINIAKSHEGLEGGNVIINDGEISLVADDDGINAAGGNDSSGMMERPGFGADKFRNGGGTNGAGGSSSAIRINGGKVIVNSVGDGIDSNGGIYISGGETVVYGPTSSMDGAIDCDGEMVMTGGTLIAGGASGMSQGLGANSTVYGANIFFGSNVSANTKILIVDAKGQEVLSYTSSKTFSSLVIASPKLAKDQTYTIKVGTETYETFTTSGTVTQVGNSGGMQGGFGGKPGGVSGQMRR